MERFPDPTGSEVGASGGAQSDSWQILIVDDDSDVFEATAYALQDVQIFGRPLQLRHARSASEALQLLAQPPEPAVILLDVVMETEQAGLHLVVRIRKELKLLRPRIILRTGQPGRAPELETVTSYDIVDYKTKDELTRQKLRAALTAALRSYDQLRRIDASHQALERMVAASQWFLGDDLRDSFADGVLTQIASFIGVEPEGLVCARSDEEGLGRSDEYRVVAAAGRYHGLLGHALPALPDAWIVAELTQSLRQRRTLIGEHSVTLHFAGATTGDDFVAFLAATRPPQDIDERLLGMFSAVLSRAARNAAQSQAATRDALTNLLTRHALAMIQRRLGRVDAGDAPTAALLIDLDEFKRVNDTHGHAVGDAVLKSVAATLMSTVRAGDLVARWGGEEFLVGLCGADEPAAMAVAEKLRSSLAATAHGLPGGAQLRITVSIGVACLQPGEGLDQALGRADNALYAAKRGGRDRVAMG